MPTDELHERDRFRKVHIHRATPYSLRPRAVITRPDNPTSGTRGRYERAQGHRGTPVPKEERSWVLAWMGMRPIGHRDLQTV